MTSSTLLEPSLESQKPWWRHLSAYHWLVFTVASMAWFFDCLDQRIFSLARIPALEALKAAGTTSVEVQSFGKVVTAYFLIGWGIGGMIFGSLGDKFGRTRMLALTILTYAMFSSLCFFSKSWFQFTSFRFMTGLGIGGVFGLAATLIAETVPSIARTQSLGLLQILSAVGNITSSGVLMGSSWLEANHHVPAGQGWRYMFLAGAGPSLVVVFALRFIKEPDAWLELKAKGLLPKGSILAPYVRLFSQTQWRRNLIVGALIATTGVVGLWGIGEYAVDLQKKLFTDYYAAHYQAPESAAALTGAAAAALKTTTVGALTAGARANAFLLNQIGAVIGMWLFTRLAMAAGRRIAFLAGFSMAMVVTVFVYLKMTTPQDAYWMMPLMGAAQLGLFAGFSIYLPELFPSSLRSTGTSFCYNLGRFAAAGGSFFSAMLSGIFARHTSDPVLPLRYAAVSMCAIFIVGIVTVPFAPETRGKPLP